MDDKITVTINGQVYEGWTSVRVTRSIEHCAADFEISVSERWGSASAPWQIKPFDACTILIGDAPVLTGFVDHYEPGYDEQSHAVTIAGRSKTEDLVDCMPDISGGQFDNYALDRIARAIAAPFGITVKVEADVGAPIQTATYEKCETAYAFLEKLCALRGVLAFDNADGNLVLAQAGAKSAAGALIEGQNIKAASAVLSGDKRFSKYVVLGQAPLSWDEQDSQPHVIGSASDSGCPRFRRLAEMAEGPVDTAMATRRAKWRALHNYGEGTKANITVQGWRQADGALWDVNTLVPVNSPRLEINRTMLIGQVSYVLSPRGTRTQMQVAPPEAFTPEAAKKAPKGKGTNDIWTQADQIG